MTSENSAEIPVTRSKLQVAFIALFPVIFQILLFFFIADWAEGSCSGKGMLGLFSFMLILASMPVAIIINIFLATFTAQVRFIWIVLLAIFIALALPLATGIVIITTMTG